MSNKFGVDCVSGGGEKVGDCRSRIIRPGGVWWRESLLNLNGFPVISPIVVTASALIVASPVQSEPVHSALREFQ